MSRVGVARLLQCITSGARLTTGFPSTAEAVSGLRWLAAADNQAFQGTWDAVATTCRPACAASWQLPISRPFSASPLSAAQPLAVEGDLAGTLSGINDVISSESVTTKDLADAALSLAYLQAKGDRRLWGKLLQSAAAHKSSFDASSLSTFLWATTAANVSHFKSLYELSAPAGKLLGSFSPAQLAAVVEALGKAGVDDLSFWKAVSAKVTPKAADYSAPQLAKILWGFAAAGVEDLKLVKAALGGLQAKASELTSRELAQTAWALAAMKRADKATLDVLSKSLGAKLDADSAPQDAVAAVWAFANLAYKPDASALSKAASVLKPAAGNIGLEQAIHAAWSLALLGSSDKELFTGLLNNINGAITAAPDAVPPYLLALAHEAQLLIKDQLGSGAPAVTPQVSNYLQAQHQLVADSNKARLPQSGVALNADVAAATARAVGAKFKPEIAQAVAALPKKIADGLTIDIGVELDKEKVAVHVLKPSDVTSTTPATPLGFVDAKRKLLDKRGYKSAFVSSTEWAGLASDKAKSSYILTQLKAAAPGASAKITALQKSLDSA